MRITNNMLISNMLTALGNNEGRMSKYQNQLNTGKKIQLPSDDPIVAARALKLRTDVSKIEQYQKNLGDAQSWVDATDAALAQIGDVLKRAKELATQAANGTNSSTETGDIGQEMKQLKIQLVHIANTTYSGRYMFSGFQTDQKLIEDDEGSADFGKFKIGVDTVTEKIQFEIGAGDNIDINVTGGDVFNLGGNASGRKNGLLTADIDNITYPYTIDGTNNVLDLTVDGVNINANIASNNYTDVDSLTSAIAKAVNDKIDEYNSTLATGVPKIQYIEAKINGGKMELRTTSKGATSAISITSPLSSFFDSVNTINIVSSPGVDGAEPAMMALFSGVIADLDSGNNSGVRSQLDQFDVQIDNLLRVRADIGARQNRIDLSADRMSNDLVNMTDLMSKNEDADPAETIMNLKMEENVYQASLAGGARIIQQTLVDFLR